MVKSRIANRKLAKNILPLFAWLALSFTLAQSSLAVDPVNVHVSAGISPNTLLYRFTKEKGFYREEGLDVLLIQAGMLPGIQDWSAALFTLARSSAKAPARSCVACR